MLYNLRVSTGGFNEGVSRLNAATLLSLLDHAKSNSVFDTSTSVEELSLCVDLAFNAERLRDLVETNKRGVANKLGGGEDSRRATTNMRNGHGCRGCE